MYGSGILNCLKGLYLLFITRYFIYIIYFECDLMLLYVIDMASALLCLPHTSMDTPRPALLSLSLCASSISWESCLCSRLIQNTTPGSMGQYFARKIYIFLKANVFNFLLYMLIAKYSSVPWWWWSGRGLRPVPAPTGWGRTQTCAASPLHHRQYFPANDSSHPLNTQVCTFLSTLIGLEIFLFVFL